MLKLLSIAQACHFLVAVLGYAQRSYEKQLSTQTVPHDAAHEQWEA